MEEKAWRLVLHSWCTFCKISKNFQSDYREMKQTQDVSLGAARNTYRVTENAQTSEKTLFPKLKLTKDLN